MIGTVTMNPCFDKTIQTDGFLYGEMNRVRRVQVDSSGKGINVSAALRNLGASVRTFGLLFEEDAHRFESDLRQQGIVLEYVTAPGRVRENIKVFNLQDQVTTELNQKGAYVPPEVLDSFTELVVQAMEELDFLVLTGSLPGGVGTDYYRKLLSAAAEKKVKCVLDAEGESFLEGLKASPFLIKPNLYELWKAYGKTFDTEEEILEKCREIIEEHAVKIICVSMGSKGALITDGREAFRYVPQNVTVRGTTGAGDSIVAGMCLALEKGLPLPEILRYGISVTNGSLEREGTLMCTKEQFDRFLQEVKVERI